MSMKTAHKKHNFCRKTAKSVARLWDDPEVFDKQTLTRVLSLLCEDAATPFAIGVLATLKAEDYDALVALTLDPKNYDNPALYRVDSQILGLIKKYPHWHIGTDPKLEAIKTFIACEVKCKETNDQVFSGSLYRDPFLREITSIAKSIIADILGECPPVTSLSFSFGPGSTYSIKNNNATAASKLCSTLDVTPNAYGLARKILLDCPGLRDDCELFEHSPGSSILSRITLIQGDRLAFVPKTALTHRPIAITGFLNSVLQKGIGKVIRDRMRPYVDLRSAQDKHRNLARSYSLSNKGCTIDLKSASDTIAYAVVMELLPFQWFDMMDKCRSKHYSYEGKWYTYHKFSAMGNAYTFELETLIFYALAEAVRRKLNIEGQVSVYGDDIIAPSQAFDTIKIVLEAYGFTFNVAKSFKEGKFRESCGGDYMCGEDVRPFYLKDYITYRTLFLFHNFLVRKGWRFIFIKTFAFIRRLLGKKVCSSLVGPDVEGDGHLVDDSLPLCSFHRIAVRREKKRIRVNLGRNVSVLLYHIYLNSIREDEDKFIWDTGKLSRSYLTFHRHI